MKSANLRQAKLFKSRNKQDMKMMLAQNYDIALKQKEKSRVQESKSALGYIKQHNEEVELENQKYNEYYNTKKMAIRHLLEGNKDNIVYKNQLKLKSDQEYDDKVHKGAIENEHKEDRVLNDKRRKRDDIKNEQIFGLNMQLKEKQEMKQVNDIQKQRDFMNSQLYMNESNLLDMKDRENYYNKQKVYKELLDEQMNFKRKIREKGRMSEIEKELNQAELKAFENKDKANYALIPGVVNQKQTTNPYFQRRSNKFSLNRGLNNSVLHTNSDARKMNDHSKYTPSHNKSLIPFSNIRDTDFKLAMMVSTPMISNAKFARNQISAAESTDVITHSKRNYGSDIQSIRNGSKMGHRMNDFIFDLGNQKPIAGLNSDQLATKNQGGNYSRYENNVSNASNQPKTSRALGEFSPNRSNALKNAGLSNILQMNL